MTKTTHEAEAVERARREWDARPQSERDRITGVNAFFPERTQPMTHKSLDELFNEHEAEAVERTRREMEAEQAAWDALPQSERDRINAARAARMDAFAAIETDTDDEDTDEDEDDEEGDA